MPDPKTALDWSKHMARPATAGAGAVVADALLSYDVVPTWQNEPRQERLVSGPDLDLGTCKQKGLPEKFCCPGVHQLMLWLGTQSVGKRLGAHNDKASAKKDGEDQKEDEEEGVQEEEKEKKDGKADEKKKKGGDDADAGKRGRWANRSRSHSLSPPASPACDWGGDVLS